MRCREVSQFELVGNDSIVPFMQSNASSLHQSLLLVEQYQQKEEKEEKEEEEEKEEKEWVCGNESCKRRCPCSLQRCPYCLTDRSSHTLHVVFMLHGFRVDETASNHN